MLDYEGLAVMGFSVSFCFGEPKGRCLSCRVKGVVDVSRLGF